MSFESRYLHTNMEGNEQVDADKKVTDINYLNFEMGSIEKYRDLDGILHFRTVFDHSDMAENELWEVLNMTEESSPLELLLNI